MPEDQGVNGDMWTNEVCRLFAKAGWEKIGDSNIDIADASGKKRGIDAMFAFEDGFRTNLKQGVFVEAKRYQTKGFGSDNLDTWVNSLISKVDALRRSPGLLDKYPQTKKLQLVTGVIGIWFHDIDNYANFRPKFVEYLNAVKIPVGRVDRDFNIQVFVLDNAKILRLVSLLEEREKWKVPTNKGETRDFKFYYPSSALFGNPVRKLDSINLEYIFSQFVLAKGKVRTNRSTKTVDMVFYFGDLDYESFERLSEALSSYDMINEENDLVIYKYRRETTEFRKIEESVKDLFNKKSPRAVFIQNMNVSDDLPTWMLED
jgi:hypothetical protein